MRNYKMTLTMAISLHVVLFPRYSQLFLRSKYSKPSYYAINSFREIIA